MISRTAYDPVGFLVSWNCNDCTVIGSLSSRGYFWHCRLDECSSHEVGRVKKATPKTGFEDAILRCSGMDFGYTIASQQSIRVSSFTQIMLLCPEIQREDREAILSVEDIHVSVFEDSERGLYVCCLTKETWRLRPQQPSATHM